jgi:hypothetical protein
MRTRFTSQAKMKQVLTRVRTQQQLQQHPAVCLLLLLLPLLE